MIEGRLGQGDSCAVYRGRWVVRLGERVVIKVLEVAGDADRLRAEWETLKALQRADGPGADHFVTRLPAPVAHGLVHGDVARPASVFGWHSGFVHTLEEVGEVHRTGVPGQVGVWLLKRLLEVLGFVHRAGFVHGAVVPDHVLVHPRDHGAMLVGWTVAVPWRDGGTRRLPAVPRRWAALYEGAREATPALDIAMACRCVRALGSEGGAIGRVLAQGLSGRADDAWALAEALTAASREAHGPAAYHPLPMPGWRH